MGGGGGFGVIPGETPVNQKNKPKIGALQNVCPKFYFQAPSPVIF